MILNLLLDPEDDSYQERLLRIAELCLEQNPNGKSTTFKVMTYSEHKSRMAFDPDQARKLVTLYPNYLAGEKTNVTETIRLVAGLREIMVVDAQGDSEDAGIYNLQFVLGLTGAFRPRASYK